MWGFMRTSSNFSSEHLSLGLSLTNSKVKAKFEGLWRFNSKLMPGLIAFDFAASQDCSLAIALNFLIKATIRFEVHSIWDFAGYDSNTMQFKHFATIGDYGQIILQLS